VTAVDLTPMYMSLSKGQPHAFFDAHPEYMRQDVAEAARQDAMQAASGPDATTSLGAAVLEAYGDQLAATDRAAADAAYQDAAAEQRSFAAAATSGGEGLARTAEADRIDAKRHR
jgi:hypothetical protein